MYEIILIDVFGVGLSIFCIGGFWAMAFCHWHFVPRSSIILSHYFINDLCLVLFDISHMSQLVLKEIVLD